MKATTNQPSPVPIGRPKDPARQALVAKLRELDGKPLTVKDPQPNRVSLAYALRNHYLNDDERLRTRSNMDGSLSLRIEKR